MQGNVVFINQKDYFFLIMLFKAGAEIKQCILQINQVGLPEIITFQCFLFAWQKMRAFE